MTLKEAIIKSLEDAPRLVSSTELAQNIITKSYYDFKDTKKPPTTVSSTLGDFIRFGDARVKRIKKSGSYFYYLTKYEQNIELDILSCTTNKDIVITNGQKKTFDEKDLHKLLSSYLKNIGIYSKTISHAKSCSKDNNQTWTHPDIIGIKFLNLQTSISQNFLKSINKVDTFKLSSYEIKKEIINDSDLKKAYFQAVSNSSWANYGYLVAFEIGDNLREEMSRLNQSFGIGIIELNANPYRSKILFPAKYKDLDFKTIDKLCMINHEFEKFIEQTDKLLTAEERYYKSTEKELNEFCDKYFLSDTEFEVYCKNKSIPLD